ncbi:hypothetical protein QBC37DRAFT_453408 [Rhypophila decipiens]|uniref:Saccharopine dehydrogenase NADP binding domain-containing protein n=1 Tax=Rhypophila decipiens TaxID=261697 RepID=A0AAN6XX80_9PEZI|nr:hypothetical protein QBC37DRAFT_453408 [Rhypophila decipiens]
MVTQVLILGATGHIGGAVLDDLLNTQPDVTVVAQVRSDKDSNVLKSQYSQFESTLQIVVAGYNDPALNSAVQTASIVINCGPDATNEENIRSLLSTLASSITANKPKFYVGTTGAALIWDSPSGNPDARTWDDVTDIDDILALPDTVTHAIPDRIVQSAAEKLNPLLHTAMVSPTFVSGISPSVKRPTPLIFPDWIHVIKTLGAGATINGGKNRTTFVEVKKLARLYTLLVGDALARLGLSLSSTSSPSATSKSEVVETWGPKAYYFAASLEIPFDKFMCDIFLSALKKHGASYLEEEVEIKDLPATKIVADMVATRHVGEPGAEIWSSHIAEGFGINMRVRGSRAEKVFGGQGFSWTDNTDGKPESIEFDKQIGNDAALEESVRVFLEIEKGN